jgi:TonB-dependent SusC/RagA subfamily outer membrane receptor
MAIPVTGAAETATTSSNGASVRDRARRLVVGVPAMAAEMSVTASVGMASAVRTAPRPVHWLVVAAWPLATLLLLAIGAWSYRRQHRIVRRARHMTIDGRLVLVTAAAGPAVFGVRGPRIIVPAWLLSRSPDEQRLVVQHEQAHIDAHDPLLLLGACALVALMPWNAAAWYMLSRLRLAIEEDCDARVLARGATARRYGALLIDLSTAAQPLPLLTGAPAFSHRASHLERRLRRMTDRPTTHRASRRLAGAALATLAFAAACGTELPTSAELEGMDVAAATQKLNAVAPATERTFVIDGRAASEAEAKAIAADRLASIEVMKAAGGKQQIRLTTRSASTATAPTPAQPATEVGEAQPVVTVAIRQIDSTGTALKIATAVAGIASRGTDTSAAISFRSTADSITVVPSKRGSDVLIFVDGVKATEDAMKMPPDRIERIEVIKGAAAEKLYGPDGAKGVIRITTKK